MRSRLMMSVSFSVLFWVARPAAAQFYTQHDFVADEAGVADHSDAHLVNAWGLVSSATSPWWVADNGTGTATLYDGHGVARALVVSIPGGAPTGIVFNGGAGFVVHTTTPPGAGPARFIFATENGVIAGWNPAVPPPPTSTHAQVAVDNSASGAVYKGLTIASTTTGDFLYATDFHNGRVDVFNSAFLAVHIPDAFTDSDLPAGYAPFGIQNIGGTIYVTYALQDAEAHDDVPGVGHGFVDAYDTAGNLLRRIASRGRLNSPWGLALAPASFGFFAGNLLVGNFGDGKINAFDLGQAQGNDEAQQRGQLHSASGPPLRIDGLWALQFGNGGSADVSKDTLFFTAGPGGEQHGLFGTIVPAPPPDDQ